MFNWFTSAVIADDKNGLGVVYKNGYGKGMVYFTAIKEYVTEEKDVELYKKVMRIVGETGYEHCDNANVSYTVRETENSYNISVLNMNCIEGSDEKFTVTFCGHTVSGIVKVGEIKSFELKK